MLQQQYHHLMPGVKPRIRGTSGGRQQNVVLIRGTCLAPLRSELRRWVNERTTRPRDGLQKQEPLR